MPLSDEEIDDLARDAFGGSDECEMLCRDLLATRDLLEGAEGATKRILLARLRAIQARRAVLSCLPCLPQ